MRVSIIGTGYVGLVSGVCFAECGHEVICVDVRQSIVDKINQGIPTIYEKGLDDLLKKNSALRATTDLAYAIDHSDITFIAVGTPFDGEKIDLSQIEKAARDIGECLREKTTRHTVVVKSTVVPGTSRDVVGPILASCSGKTIGTDIGLAMNPEFLREGEAIDDFMQPDRIVIGVSDAETEQALRVLYAKFDQTPMLVTSLSTAEMIKYTSNSLFATLISFANEIANISALVDEVDVVEVMQGVHADKRLTPLMPDGEYARPGVVDYIKPGCGFGGSCFPKDVSALAAFSQTLGHEPALLNSVLSINADQPAKTLALIARHYDSFEGLKVTLCGVAFKPGTDDVRESPALTMIELLKTQGAQVSVIDPCVNVAEHDGLQGLNQYRSLAQAVAGSDVLVLVTTWPEFEQLPELVAECKPVPLVIDGRRHFAKTRFTQYEGIGL